MESPRFPSGPKKRTLSLLVAVSIALVLAVVLVAVFHAHRALNRATRAAASEGQLPFSLELLDLSDNFGRRIGSEAVAPGARFTRGTYFDGNLYLGGDFGVSVVRPDGKFLLKLRSGFELPSSPISNMAQGRIRGSSEPQLLLATNGAGLLLFEPNSRAEGTPTIRQLLPADIELRDLTALLPLESGDVLLGTRHRGVLLFSGTTLTPLRFAIPGVNPAALEITSLAAVDSASFLVGTRDSGIFYFHGGTVDHVDSSSGLPDDQVESIVVSPAQAPARAFVGTPVGTAEFNLAATSFRPIRLLAQGLFSHALAIDEQELTIGTLDQGIQQSPFENGFHRRNISLATSLGSNSVQRIDAFFRAPGALYAVADGSLLRRIDDAWIPVLTQQPAALADPNISALAFAPDGTLYVGFFDHGIDLLNPEGSIRHFEDDHLFCIDRLVVDPDRHTIAAATANGLVLFDAQGNPRQTLTRRDGLISDHITDVAFTGNGTALATPAGITFLGTSESVPESLYAFQGLVNNHVYTLAGSKGSDQLLAGTLGGISILTSKTVQRNLTAVNSGLKHNWVTALLTLPDNTVLVGTYGAGIETLDHEGHVAPIELPAGIPRDLVINPNALFATASHIYAGTLGHGMLVYSLSSGRWSAIRNGLPSLNVTAFASRAGEIYVGTENGLVRIPEANLL